MMITFRKITEENFDAILRMDAGDGHAFVPPNAEWLAQAWLYYENHDVYPFAIYAGETPVGLMELDEDLDARTIFLWRVMIHKPHQGKGYGRAAVEKLIALCRESGKYDVLGLGCKPENAAGMHLYKSLGFAPTGEEAHGEVQMRFTL